MNGKNCIRIATGDRMSSAPAKKQDRKSSSLIDDDDEYDVFEMAPLFAPLRHALPRRVAMETRQFEDSLTSLTTEVTRTAADKDFSVQELQELIESTEKIGDLIGNYIGTVQRTSGRHGPVEQNLSEVEDD